ncbi:MAG: type I restriction enzyme HsdR N-terminal domain-containing protein, partial [Treponema sp.]|nr:type I restriction enzyme HsdR N-terminal domain-containing protein [Treponema sp.]
MTLETILKDSPYRLAQFSEEQVQHIEKAVITRSVKGKDVYYITCPIRKKEIRLTPEEVIRQLYLDKLLHAYRYPRDLIQVESEVTFGREKKRADIVIFDKDKPAAQYVIVELKKPKLKDGKEQLKSY